MSQRNFKKEDFVKNNDGKYELTYQVSDIGEGSNLTIERKNDKGEFEIVQAEINRFEDNIFILWSEPFDGRLIFEG
ncbi:glutathione synthase [Chryseobacterium sp. T16E-39]|uniref:glutathione synthase n=1 Tax=Chryseobacterium sp. T16E-39 TaxID=2015076 RepID=UPI000B5B2161|nr:glutathione synthase [Chryseobacterium sp. T16E-39]ASK29322.1 glutathione synthase [Chryseobacterium sp. T16E-39]